MTIKQNINERAN